MDSPAGPRRTPTLADIAALSGVATSTVSRALSGPRRVNDATRERIERAAAELGYVSRCRVRPLPAGRPRAIAVLVSDVTNPFYFGIVRGTQHQLKAAGYQQILVDTEESDELEDDILRNLRSSFDGAILAASRLTDRRLTALSEELPLIAINRQTRGVPNVFIDTPTGFQQALTHLVSLGHRDIAYLAGPDTSWANETRWRTLARAAAGHGLSVRRLGPFLPSYDPGAAAADAAIAAGVTACIAFNDLIAIGVLGRLAERGVKVPQDMSVVGCDDIFGADFCNPPLTTLTQPTERAGRTAVDILVSRLNAHDEREMRRSATLPTHLTVRASSGPAPATEGVPGGTRAASGHLRAVSL
ncbi:LacI family DNA-binding transcriptional regulator [Leifsonia sp. L25]|uniref:LacI family DNA-binding transcriptional regulator n=1 Tax=Actinomycetes TaxID=1760 RepID=UPI003D682220